MKKIFVFVFACAAMLSSCSDKELADSKIPEGTVIFNVSTKNSHTARALYSSEEAHNVSNVVVYAFKESVPGGPYVYDNVTIPLEAWTLGTDSLLYNVPNASKFPAGKYQFIAVGRTAEDTGLLPSSADVQFGDFINRLENLSELTEIFSGSKAAEVVNTGDGMRVDIIITRQVVGLLGYFTDIPSEINDTPVASLRLTVSNSNLGVNLTDSEGVLPTGATYDLIYVDFNGRQVDPETGFYLGNAPIDGVDQLSGSQLNGAYAYPIDGVTLTLGLYDAEGNALKTWSVEDANGPILNFTANDFYSIGQKKSDEGTTGPDAEDPTDDDKAVSLMRDQIITVTVSPEWGTNHDLILK